MNPFDFVESINNTKIDLIRTKERNNNDYSSYIINKQFSYFPDTVYDAQEMNERYLLDNIMQYDYLRLTVKKKKRYTKWGKKDENDIIILIAELFNFSIQKSKDVLRILTKQQINELAAYVDKGGVIIKEKKK